MTADGWGFRAEVWPSPDDIIMARSVAAATDVLHSHANVTQRLRAKEKQEGDASERKGARARDRLVFPVHGVA